MAKDHPSYTHAYGTDLPQKVKAKLAARQILAAHSMDPGQSIQFPWNVGTENNTMTVGEALGPQHNFGGDADLSSRTPVVRLWTAVRLLEKVREGAV